MQQRCLVAFDTLVVDRFGRKELMPDVSGVFAHAQILLESAPEPGLAAAGRLLGLPNVIARADYLRPGVEAIVGVPAEECDVWFSR